MTPDPFDRNDPRRVALSSGARPHRTQPRQQGARQQTAAQQPGSCQFGGNDPRLKQYESDAGRMR